MQTLHPHGDLRKLLLKEEYKAERFIALFRVIFYALALLEVGTVIAVGLGDDFSRFLPHALALFGFSVFMLLDVYFIGRKRMYHFFNRYYKYLVAAVDVTSTAIFAYALHDLIPPDASGRLMLSLIGLAIGVIVLFASVFRYSSIHSIYNGVLLMTGYMILGGVLGIYRNPLEYIVYQGQYNLLAMLYFWSMTTLTVLAALVSRNIRRMLLLSKTQANLARFLPEIIVQDVLEGEKSIEVGGRKQRATILFSDIRNFTGMSEDRDPEEVIEFLNSYFNDMIGVLFRYNGTLDKLLGDGLMAIFGAPFASQTDEDNAVRTAIDMHRSLSAFNELRGLHGKDPVHMGIGIHSGDVVMGNVGMSRRMEFTVIGDTVNTASRLEGLTKKYHAPIIISEETRQRLSGDYPLELIGEETVKGRTHAIRFYSVAIPDAPGEAVKADETATANPPVGR